MNQQTAALTAFLDSAHSVYHAVAYLVKTLETAGYSRLEEKDLWTLQPGGKYYLTRGGSAVLAFRIPHSAPKGFLMSAAHSDRPTFKVNFQAPTPALPQRNTAACSWEHGWIAPCLLPAGCLWRHSREWNANSLTLTGICF